jgi:putative ATPase
MTTSGLDQAPLAALLRPQSLDDFMGQEHLVGQGKPLRAAVELGAVFSMLFWGPPGVGKTTLARIIAKQTGREFIEISAVSAGKADLKAVVESASRQRGLTENYLAPVLFVDEIHRFSKIQQDFLLPYVESGVIILIGATTENPSFEVISALLSGRGCLFRDVRRG